MNSKALQDEQHIIFLRNSQIHHSCNPLASNQPKKEANRNIVVSTIAVMNSCDKTMTAWQMGHKTTKHIAFGKPEQARKSRWKRTMQQQATIQISYKTGKAVTEEKMHWCMKLYILMFPVYADKTEGEALHSDSTGLTNKEFCYPQLKQSSSKTQ